MTENRKKWYRLDNVAKIIPSQTEGADTRIMRLSCELKEDVDPEILQAAFDRSISEFHYFNSVLRKGLFWYYLDESEEHYVVRREDTPAFSPLYFPGRRCLLYRVNYFGRRINLEMFHVLADGTGAFEFFRTLILYYLSMRHGLSPAKDPAGASVSERTDDSYRQFYTSSEERSQLKTLTSNRAYQIRLARDGNMQNHIVEGAISASAFLKLARSHETTAGILSTALFIEAILEEMGPRDRRLPIVISVPVNLRSFFPSRTTRNFFGVIRIAYRAEQYDGTLSNIIGPVAQDFDRQLQIDQITGNMNSYSALEHNLAIKMVPLFIKDIVTGQYNRAAKKGVTASMSNIGVIRIPEEYVPYIDRFCGSMSSRNMQMTVTTFEDRMVFGAVSGYEQHSVLLHFFRKMADLGLDVELSTNDYNAPEAERK